MLKRDLIEKYKKDNNLTDEKFELRCKHKLARIKAKLWYDKEWIDRETLKMFVIADVLGLRLSELLGMDE